MYDMYPWDARAAAAAKPDDPGPDPAAQAAQAVQVALDRRDNGGASAHSKKAADPHALGLAVAGRARQ